MNSTIHKELNGRYKLLMKAQKTPKGSVEWSNYRIARNRCTNLLRTAESNYWQSRFNDAKSSKEFWQVVKLMQGKCKAAKIGPIQGKNWEIISDDKTKANTLDGYFSNIGKNLSQAIVPPNPAPEIQHVYRITPTLSNIKLEKELLVKSFKEHVREGNACGPDNILGKELKMIGEIATEGLYHIVEKSITSCKYPTQWKTARVRCAHKKGSTLECGNYRPISLLSIPGKLLESIVCKQIDNHLNDNNLISNG